MNITGRRLDEWVDTSRMKKSTELVDLKEEEKKKRKVERMNKGEEDSEDGEHEGMDDNAIQQHEDATKVKTILDIGTVI